MQSLKSCYKNIKNIMHIFVFTKNVKDINKHQKWLSVCGGIKIILLVFFVFLYIVKSCNVTINHSYN